MAPRVRGNLAYQDARRCSSRATVRASDGHWHKACRFRQVRPFAPIVDLVMEDQLTSDVPSALEWAEIAGLVDIRPNGSWQMTEFARDWFNKNPPSTPNYLIPVPYRSAASALGRKGD